MQEITNVVESRYTYVLESLEKSKEKVGNLQTQLAYPGKSTTSIPSMRFLCSLFMVIQHSLAFFNNDNVYLVLSQLAILLYYLFLLGKCCVN